jgi:hypothetical protein
MSGFTFLQLTQQLFPVLKIIRVPNLVLLVRCGLSGKTYAYTKLLELPCDMEAPT